ncbi:thiamine-phosphate kinase [Aquirhabdus parva]|uniref:Thiamine-monophosphate kinase n=1 Tax=Aquirhabdus parva TaxID=2283318 RepID=A0A345P2K1_9GAMM|nr:thiamine-phosphate kinase [Aquirhabdus parva]AXI01510.1 thiamine-phosphate kinase [Aquirhabdus parva]
MDEFSLIHRYFQRPENSPASSGIRLGIGDDAAILTPPAHHELVISTDTLISGRHFPIDTDPYSIGWKAAAVNLSDLAAMGAKPHSILLALTLPEANPDFLEPLADGLFALCDAAQVKLIGGDTTRGQTLSLTVTALGWVPTGQAILRSGAQIGDLIVVSGTLGDAAYALQHLNNPALDPELKSRLDRPTPRLALGLALRGYASAMLDISDGLAQDLGHILKESGVWGQIHLEDLPLSPTLAALNPEQRAALALSGGDDYELCFTISPSKFAILQSVWGDSSPPLNVIGQINARDHNKNEHPHNNLTVLYQQKPFILTQQGFRHFE